MRNWTSRRTWAAGVGLLGLATLAVCWSQRGLRAQTPAPKVADKAEAPGDYSRRVVAYIFNTIPITREELGEYLIARQGTERLDFLINKRIIEHFAKQKGIEVTAAEVEAALEDDTKGFGVSRMEFVNKLLKQRHMTLYEYKEDVIRLGLLMSRMCRERVKVTEEEIKKGFEAYYGEKVECRMILWPLAEKNIAFKMYAELRDSEEAFDKAAKAQADSRLAAAGGRLPPFGRNTTGNPELEKAAFKLQPGEVSELLGTPEGYVVLKCIKHVPPDTTKKLEDVRADLEKEVFQKKVQLEIPVLFKEMREQAQVVPILKSETTEEQLLRDARREISELNKPALPKGN
jgi:parvulin-like peptidyl-prolyl isomerase